VPVEVPAEDGREARGQLAGADDVVAVLEGEGARAAGRALHALVQAEDAQVGLRLAMPGGLEERGEPVADPARVREAGEGHPEPPGLEDHGARAVEHLEALVERQQRVREAGALVVAGHQEHRDARGCHALEGGQRGLGEPGGDAAAVMQIAAVEHHVHLPGQRRLKGALEVAKEVLSPAAPRHPRPGGQVEAQVRVGHEEDSHHSHSRIRARGAGP
jgi:hypothetical protein